jgi:hypothetical protein
MPLSIVTAERRYAQLVATLTSRRPSVTATAVRKRGLGSTALCVHGRIFASLSSTEQLVVKLAKERVDALVAAGCGARFEPSHGRPMHEWFVAGLGHEKDWLSLAEEALSFAGSLPEEPSNDMPP